MKISGKHLAIGVGVTVIAALLVVIFLSVRGLFGSTDPPDGVHIGETTLTPVTQPPTTTTTQTPTTVTITKPAWPTETAHTLNPPEPECVQSGISTKGWDDEEDRVSDPPDDRPGVMALGNVDGVYFDSGECFDEMVVKTDTAEAVGFDVQYVPASEITGIASNLPVALQGKAYLKLVVTAHVSEDTDHAFGGATFSPHGDSFPAILGVQYLGYQEGRLAFGLAVSDRLPIAATRIDNPDNPGTVAVALRIAHQ